MGASISTSVVFGGEGGADGYGREKLRTVLASMPFLANVSSAVLDELATKAQIKTYQNGDIIVGEGDAGNGFYIMLEGDALISKRHSETQVSMTFASVQKGDYFGECAIIQNAPRSATVTAACKVLALFVGSHDFGAWFRHVNFARRRGISRGSLVRATKEGHVLSLRKTEKPTELRRKMITSFQDNFSFHELYYGSLADIIDHMYPVTIQEGDVLLHHGRVPERMFYLESGAVSGAWRRRSDDPPRVLEAGSIVGDIALMNGEMAQWTFTASTLCKCWCIGRVTLQRIMSHVSDDFIAEIVDIFKTMPLFGHLANEDREYLAEACHVHNVPANHVLVRQGRTGDCMYFVKTGKVDMVVESLAVHTLEAGEYAGEQALASGEFKWECSLRSKTKTIVLSLTRDDWLPINTAETKEMESGSHTHDMVSQVEAVKRKEMSAGIVDTNVGYDDLRTIGTVMVTHLGITHLVRHRESGRTYMLQTVSKEIVERERLHVHLVEGARVWQTAQSPFVLTVHQLLHDANRVSFLHDPMLGGDLKSLLANQGVFPETLARFYAAQLVLVLETLHSQNALYRSLAPENVMLDAHGYIRLASFDFAKNIRKHARTNSSCGTPDFMSPEVVTGKRYNRSCDWWALGVLVFEMLCGFAPFAGACIDDTYTNITSTAVNVPLSVSPAARKLIASLLEPNVKRRLGHDIAAVKGHDWFHGVNWRKLRLHAAAHVPHKPEIKDDEDLTNFNSSANVTVIPPYTGKDKRTWQLLLDNPMTTGVGAAANNGSRRHSPSP